MKLPTSNRKGTTFSGWDCPTPTKNSPACSLPKGKWTGCSSGYRLTALSAYTAGSSSICSISIRLTAKLLNCPTAPFLWLGDDETGFKAEWKICYSAKTINRYTSPLHSKQ